ncbi:hypothetical protein KNP414_00963 [Paenibacillus mucilaginosus KNP414]|uniref:Uncharacterized protein n=1 Tax=Paenibacillus mucilaginosus (strain KNP414) TaxID=1036673 RepID=F8FAA0_PAEMK|nr:hypothetical protein KNP414_00963 [Paenibacillus mucilaginosus KNP414]
MLSLPQTKKPGIGLPGSASSGKGPALDLAAARFAEVASGWTAAD